MEEIAAQLEMYLIARADWVPVDEICARFNIDERELRASGKRRPICHNFAISSSSGLKHLAHCSFKERIAYKHNRRRRLVAEKRALQDYDRAFHNCLTGKRPELRERHSGQMLFLQ